MHSGPDEVALQGGGDAENLQVAAGKGAVSGGAIGWR